MKKLLIAAIVLLFAINTQAQILTPVKWSYAAKKVSATEAVVFFKATIDEGWHVYSQTVKDGGPVKTTITFTPSKEYTLDGATAEPTPVTRFEKAFSMNVSFFEHSVIFQQKIKLKAGQTVVKGQLEYMTCNDHQCLPPDDVDFSIPVK
ncbi:protein-disulfide reductase DsbD domain-containing protein [Mucilaginibacter jinjuensis]|uniref:Protein-disulfide reductase DsbD family protein n=1 Tax=Mucilaginibacter jinjuensis TaxID=1176721 RepID=A0ABY7TCD1_9SPHI|nr:protein-disulfide reductase DsbD domain-containing protein [Mucilaginibacter jinjuensis]WCT14101.1 protein-disulfide reductase DsbD family protein [Mucilaginibacter jinjuensis]